MTDVQRIVSALADCLHDNQISEDECLGVLKVLRGIPPEQHMDALKAFIGVEEPPEPEEKPEDYLAVKTFTTDEFHIGDEVAWGEERCVIYRFDDENAYVFGSDTRSILRKGSAFHRTGRNFPAIPAILEELKKG